jgi:hypothetical protein
VLGVRSGSRLRLRLMLRCLCRRLLLYLGTRDAVGREEGDEFLFRKSEAEGAERDTEFMVI